ncbi:MAG TPA: acyl carrier protein [Candidatus Bariatricus faecipullorum]|nr:acyl carrier protein [Candidatus Bariatricus faecipullorum]
MTNSEILDIIKEIVFYVSGIRTLTMDTDFVKDLALNSLDVANMVAAFEERFQVRIPVTDVWKMAQVRDVVEYIQNWDQVSGLPGRTEK